MLNHYLLTREELEWRASDLFGWALSGHLDYNIESTFPLEQAARLHDLLTGGETTGKMLLDCM